ncbi:MAG: sugar transferase [Calditrichaeota bacterium]|nr:sugar transferase [Calditrichota bacterium]
MRSNLYSKFFKHLMDKILAFISLIAFSPILLVSALFIKLEDGDNIFFKQIRVGRDFKLFNLFKFRTMSNKINGSSITQSNDIRITKTGRVLRKLKIDELPQLFNILLGQMSIVGPRPELEKYINHYMEDYKTILNVKPGLSDFASIKYRNEEQILARYENLEEAYLNIVLPDKINLNKQYVNSISFKTDLKIIYQTIRSVFNVT